MRGILFRRPRFAAGVGAAEGQALMQALHRIRQQGDARVRREAEQVLRQVLTCETHAEGARLARRVLHSIADGPEPRAALIAARCWALRAGRSFLAAARAERSGRAR